MGAMVLQLSTPKEKLHHCANVVLGIALLFRGAACRWRCKTVFRTAGKAGEPLGKAAVELGQRIIKRPRLSIRTGIRSTAGPQSSRRTVVSGCRDGRWPKDRHGHGHRPRAKGPHASAAPLAVTRHLLASAYTRPNGSDSKAAVGTLTNLGSWAIDCTPALTG